MCVGLLLYLIVGSVGHTVHKERNLHVHDFVRLNDC